MKFAEIVRTILKKENVTQKELAERMGYEKKYGIISTMLMRKDIYTRTFVKMLDRLGYEVVIQRKTTGERPEGQMVMDYFAEESNNAK